MRRYSHVVYSRARRSNSRRIDRTVRGRPPRRVGRVWRAGGRSGHDASAAWSPSAPVAAVCEGCPSAADVEQQPATPGQMG